MNFEFDRSLDRLVRSEEHRNRVTGFGTTKQGAAIVRQYREQLADRIAADRARGSRDKDLWRALKGIDADGLSWRMLVAGVSVCASDTLGADDDGEKNFRDIALWLGRNFGHRGKLGLKVGAWAAGMLTTLPIFRFDGDAVLTLPLTDGLDAFLTEIVANGVAGSPLLSPLDRPPQDWTQVRKGGFPPGHWARVP